MYFCHFKQKNDHDNGILYTYYESDEKTIILSGRASDMSYPKSKYFVGADCLGICITIVHPFRSHLRLALLTNSFIITELSLFSNATRAR